MLSDEAADYEDTGGVGGTLAGNPLSLAAVRATLEHVLTEDAFAAHDPPRGALRRGDRGGRRPPPGALERHPARLPGRVPLRGASRPATAAQAHAAADPELERYLHLHALNRGVMLTPFHNMALISPQTSEADVDLHTEVFDQAVASLAA